MAIFELQGSDGSTYEVDAPDEGRAVAAFKKMATAPAPTPPPSFDQSRFDEAPEATAMASGMERYAQERGPPSRTTSAALSALQGATFNFADEAAGGINAGIDYVTGNAPEGFGAAYDKRVGQTRELIDSAQKANPGISIAGELGGALATLPVTGGASLIKGAVGLGQRMMAGAKVGAASGAAYGAGAGEGFTDTLTDAAKGGLVGGALGAAVPVAIGGAQAAGRGIRNAYDEVAGTARGALNTEAEAARRIAVAQKADHATAAKQQLLNPAEEAQAIAAGQPILNIDRGGLATHRLARAANNLSPEAGIELKAATGDRWGAAGDRVRGAIQRIVGGSTTDDARQQLIAQATRENAPAYRKAFSRPGAQSVWDEGLEVLAGATVVQHAIRQAAVTGRNQASVAGHKPMRSPFHIDPQTGGMGLRPNPDGSVATPTLEFWNAVKINLDGIGTREARSSAKVLREHLDTIVPEYGAARAGAAKFFGARDVVDAGEEFVTSSMANAEARRGVSMMKPAERKLFAESYADALTRKVLEIERAGGRGRDVINSAFLAGSAARQRTEIALGPQKAKELEAFLRVEYLMDRARQQVSGNSWTVQGMVDAGIGTTGAGYGAYTGDWGTAGSMIGFALLKAGRRNINTKVAEKVGEMLASPDPDQVQRGLKMIVNNGKMMDALRAADLPAARAAAQQSSDIISEGDPSVITVKPRLAPQ